MSGGSYNNTYWRIEDEYVGRMYDPVMNRMMADLAVVLKALEWWQSGDIGEEEYREKLKGFKRKYFKDYSETTKGIILEKVEKLLIEAGIKDC